MNAITVIVTAGVGAFVAGRAARGLLEEVTGRPPVLALSGWATTAKAVPDLLALAEQRGIRVYLVDETEVSPL